MAAYGFFNVSYIDVIYLTSSLRDMHRTVLVVAGVIVVSATSGTSGTVPPRWDIPRCRKGWVIQQRCLLDPLKKGLQYELLFSRYFKCTLYKYFSGGKCSYCNINKLPLHNYTIDNIYIYIYI